eukprot:11772030-Alexandrium_andersonii.AAC.1
MHVAGLALDTTKHMWGRRTPCKQCIIWQVQTTALTWELPMAAESSRAGTMRLLEQTRLPFVFSWN